jgi:hypothetical protein
MARRAGTSVVRIVVLFLVVLSAIAIFASYPGLKGFHYGCNIWMGDGTTTTWLGLQFCRAGSPSSTEGTEQAVGSTTPAPRAETEAEAQQRREKQLQEESDREQEERERPTREAEDRKRTECESLASEGKAVHC